MGIVFILKGTQMRRRATRSGLNADCSPCGETEVSSIIVAANESSGSRRMKFEEGMYGMDPIRSVLSQVG